MIIKIDVPAEAWLSLMGAWILSSRQRKELHIDYLCLVCQKPHQGIFLSAHPEKLQIQILVGH